MKTSCRIIEDLLPMYHDGICSEESRAMVEEHLKDCAACRGILATLRGEIEIPGEKPADDLKPLKGIQQRLKKEKKRSGRRYAAIAVAVVLLIIPLLCLGWNQYWGRGLNFTNLSEYQTGTRFMWQITEGDYENAYRAIDMKRIRRVWSAEWFEEETLSTLETDAREKFCEYGKKLEDAGGIDSYEYIGITKSSEEGGNPIYRLIFKVQYADETQTFHVDVSQDGVVHFGGEGSFVDDPLAQFSIWLEYLWQDYAGCYFDPDRMEYVYDPQP